MDGPFTRHWLNPANAKKRNEMVDSSVSKGHFDACQVQAQELTLSVGEEITRMIFEQKDLEEKFDQLVTMQHSLRNMPNKSKLRENQVRILPAAPPCEHTREQQTLWGVLLAIVVCRLASVISGGGGVDQNVHVWVKFGVCCCWEWTARWWLG